MYVLFFVFWILLNGRITTEIVLFGLVISAAIYWFICKYMDFSIRKDLLLWKSLGFLLFYLGVLIKEIAVANLNVMKLVYSPKMAPEPGLVYFKADLKSGLARVLLANSITLTPGTVTVSLEGNQYCVHCLDMSFGDGIENCIFVQLLKKWEEGWNE